MTKMVNLNYSMISAYIDHGEKRHPQKVMQELGITYEHATPQSMLDCWWFWCCKVPEGMDLPGYIRKLNLDPFEAIGNGLRREDAEKIAAIIKEEYDD